MNEKRYLSLNGLSGINLLFILISVGMIVVSIYLTNHFYEAHFPTGFSKSTSLCDGNGFWGCDKTTLSALGNIFNIPTAFFGIIIGVLGLIGSIFPSKEFESTNKFLFMLNAVGCVVLLLFSIIALGGLCQFCSLYYLLSFIAFFIFWKKSDAPAKPDIKFLVFAFVIVLIPGIYLNSYYDGKEQTKKNLNAQYIKQFEGLENLGNPITPSPISLYKSTDKFEDASIQISVFSDFQCPFCEVVSTQLHDLIEEFKGKINIQYMFYPLDASCNKNIKGRFHESACAAAYLSACDPNKFSEIHDFIFKNQKEINADNLRKWEKDFGLSGCLERKDLKDMVVQTIAAGEQYKVKSTPTIIINGKKIEGTIPTMHLKAILNSLL